MLDDAVDQFRALGQNQAVEISLAVRGFFAETGGVLRTARADWEELLVSARRRDNTEHVVWGMALLVPLLLDLGRHAEALRTADEAAEAFAPEHRLFGPMLHAAQVRVNLARGKPDEARDCAHAALDGLGRLVQYHHLVGLTALVRGCLEVLESGARGGTVTERDDLALARRALHALRGYARLYPFAHGRYELYAGRFRAAQGDVDAARRHWRRGLEETQEAGLRLDSARIRLLLAASLPEGPDRAEHLRAGARTLEELGLTRLPEFEELTARTR
jgi:tetratricopeptide (TPR) repeat protein